jgi:hypothetical protein
MKANKPIEFARWRRPVRLIALALVGLAAATVQSLQATESRPRVRITWTDTGVYMLERPAPLKDHDRFLFQSFDGAVEPVTAGVPSAGQILIPMPDNGSLPRTQAGWDQFRVQLEQGIKERIDQALSQGVTDFEIRTVQNITIKSGYWAPWQQARIVQFGQTFLEALSKVRESLAQQGPVEVHGMVGSNGGLLATESIARMGRSPLDHLTIVDGRAYVSTVSKTAEIMKGKLTLVNTGGDAWALADMVAHHAGAKAVKGADPRVRVVYVDPQGWNFLATAHIAAMTADRNRPVLAKEFLGNGYSQPMQTTIGEVRDALLRGEAPGQVKGVSLQMEISDRSFEPDASGQSRALKESLLKQSPGPRLPTWPADEIKP